MIIDPRSFTERKHLKIAYLKALANTLGGDIEVTLGDKLKMQGVGVYEGEIRLTLPKEKRKEANRQLQAFKIKRLKENVETYLRPATVARLMAEERGKPIGKSDDGRWILCPPSRILTTEEGFIPFITGEGIWITKRGAELPRKFRFEEAYKFPLKRVPKPLTEWSEKVAAVYGKMRNAKELRERIAGKGKGGEELLTDEEEVIGGAADELLKRLEAFISLEGNASSQTFIDASGIGETDFLALLVTALLAKGTLAVSSPFLWREEVITLVKRRRKLIWIISSVVGAGKFFDVLIYRRGSTYVMERTVDIGRARATFTERFRPMWELFKGET